MRILGIDPGTNLLGMAVLEEDRSNSNGIILVASGLLDLRKESRKQVDKIVFSEVRKAIQDWAIEELAIEDQFIGVNPRSGMAVAKAKNAAILAAQMANIPHFEYSPTTVKHSATGAGNADKECVSQIVCSILGIKKKPSHYDETDAMAVAICHLNKCRAYELSKRVEASPIAIEMKWR
jgi:crossover junction endodeoxyribonuclease RuvC